MGFEFAILLAKKPLKFLLAISNVSDLVLFFIINLRKSSLSVVFREAVVSYIFSDPYRFWLSQTDDFLIVTIRAPYSKLSEAEITFDGREFYFSAKPYYLRLYLPCEVVEDDRESAEYDADSGIDSCF